jgi:hypothetical protein
MTISITARHTFILIVIYAKLIMLSVIMLTVMAQPIAPKA